MPSPLSHRVFALAAVCTSLMLSACTQERPRPVFMVVESADAALAEQDYTRAAAEYREAVSRRPAEWRARKGLAQALLGLNRPAEAREQAELVFSIRPNDPESIELLATTMLRSGDAAGMESLLRGRANESGNPDDWMLLADLLAETGDADAAEVAYLTAATTDQGRSIKYQLALADFYLSVGDNAEALTRYRMALYLDPADEHTRAAIRSLGQIPGPTLAIRPREAR